MVVHDSAFLMVHMHKGYSCQCYKVYHINAMDFLISVEEKNLKNLQHTCNLSSNIFGFFGCLLLTFAHYETGYKRVHFLSRLLRV